MSDTQMLSMESSNSSSLLGKMFRRVSNKAKAIKSRGHAHNNSLDFYHSADTTTSRDSSKSFSSTYQWITKHFHKGRHRSIDSGYASAPALDPEVLETDATAMALEAKTAALEIEIVKVAALSAKNEELEARLGKEVEKVVKAKNVLKAVQIISNRRHAELKATKHDLEKVQADLVTVEKVAGSALRQIERLEDHHDDAEVEWCRQLRAAEDRSINAKGSLTAASHLVQASYDTLEAYQGRTLKLKERFANLEDELVTKDRTLARIRYQDNGLIRKLQSYIHNEELSKVEAASHLLASVLEGNTIDDKVEASSAAPILRNLRAHVSRRVGFSNGSPVARNWFNSPIAKNHLGSPITKTKLGSPFTPVYNYGYQSDEESDWSPVGSCISELKLSAATEGDIFTGGAFDENGSIGCALKAKMMGKEGVKVMFRTN